MKIELDLKKWAFELCMVSPAVFTLLYCFSAGLARKSVLVIMALDYLLLNKIYIEKKERFSIYAFNLLFLFYVSYTAYIEGISALIHTNFYGFVLMIIMFLLISDDDIRAEFAVYFKAGKKRFLIYTLICYGCILLSVFFLNGLQYSATWNTVVLYGPFDLPHLPAYIMLVIYCGLAVYDKESHSIVFLALKGVAVVCIIWTAVRSAVLALVILILVDFFSIRGFQKKSIIFITGVVLLVWVGLYTDLLTNNPLIEKTIYAADTVGSITNGREWYREAALTFYQTSTDFIQKLFGVGIEGVIQCIYNALGVEIHAHNDYVNVLVGFGAVGLAIMIVCQLRLIKVCKGKFNKLALQGFVFILAYYNGFAMYIMLTIAFPIITCFFESKDRRNTAGTDMISSEKSADDEKMGEIAEKGKTEGEGECQTESMRKKGNFIDRKEFSDLKKIGGEGDIEDWKEIWGEGDIEEWKECLNKEDSEASEKI